ncbi:MAG: ABC transporter permease [Streptosporangiaceae bacterium]|nr:ABC transporter permease [Streptosporangiaceae bacterium]
MKLVRDTWLIFQYEVALQVRNPVNVAITLIQPITYLLLFTPFLKSVMHASSYSNAFQIYVPSLFAAMGVFSGMFAGFALLGAIRQGVVTRHRVTPISRVSLLLGRVLMYILLLGFQGVIVTAGAIALGLRVQPGNFLFALVLLSLMVTLSVSVGYDLALLVPNESTLGTLLNSVSQPISLLAGVLIPLSVAPLWVRRVADWNPFAWGTNGMRAIFQGHIGSDVVWQATLVMGLVALVTLVLSSRLFSREIA